MPILRITALVVLRLSLLPPCVAQQGGELTRTESADAITIRVMTYNIMWEENGVRAGNLALPVWRDRCPLVGQILRENAPDIVGLQEASPEQQAGLAAVVPEFGIVYDPMVNNTSPILYRKEQLAVEGSGTFVLNSVPERPATNIGLRKATFARFRDKATGRRFVVFNVHLDHRGNGSTRQISAVRLSERMATESGPVLLTGDFNCHESSPTMQFLYGQTALKNDLEVLCSNPVPFRDALETVRPALDLIDHVLVGSGVDVASAARLKNVDAHASDHFPVVAVVRLLMDT